MKRQANSRVSIKVKYRIRSLVLACVLLACNRDEPTVAGESLSHWASEARKVSFLSFWNSDKDERRRVAFQHLTELGEPAVPVLLDLLRNDSRPVSGDALNALAALGPRARSAVPDLMEMLASEDTTKRVAVIMILGRIGPDAAAAVPALTRALHDPDARVARVAAGALAGIGPIGQRALDQAARSSDATVRQSAVSGIAAIPRTAADTREYVRRALSDASPGVRARGVDLLGSSAPGTIEKSVDLLVRGMRDSSTEVRDAARRAFQTTARYAESPGLLTAVMTGGDSESRANAAWRLGLTLRSPVGINSITPESRPEIRSALEKALADSDVTVRVYAARAMLAGYPDDRAHVAAQLRREIPDADVAVALRGASVLWELNHRERDVEAALLAGLASKDQWVRMETLGEILKMGTAAESLIPALERLRSDPSREVRARAERALAVIKATVSR